MANSLANIVQNRGNVKRTDQYITSADMDIVGMYLYKIRVRVCVYTDLRAYE